jgi:hypothetical protein
MNRGKRSRLGALLGASVLTLGVVTIALAIELKEEHQGITVSWDSEGNAVVEGEDISINQDADCANADLDPGEVEFHFVQSGTDVVANAAGNNLLDVDFEDEANADDVAEDSIQGNGTNVDWFVTVDASDGEVTVVTANSNVSGGELRISHICTGDVPETETEAPSFEQSQGGETDEPSEPVITDEPSFEQSQGGETDAPSFEQTQGGATDEPSEPDTATIGGKDVGSPADSAWLLVVALGVLLASIVVLTPARAKSRR